MRYEVDMTAERIAEFQKIIEQTLAELKDSEIYLKDATKPIEPSVALGRLTRMEAIGEKGVNEARQTEVKRRIERLGNALERIKRGEYGLCIRCGKEIPYERLLAVPEALICVPCAERKRR